MFSQATFLFGLAATATAHMVITNPVPFGQDTLNNSPLVPADFPCKQRSGVYAVTKMNQWDAGTTQVVTFMGSAVHGGGSCQFSITTDPEPTEKSQWKVIQSVIGNCPSDTPGNFPENATLIAEPGTQGPSTFPVTMPIEIPDGRYTFAWTWLNKKGNREFYMNCAPIQVGSGSGSASTASVTAALGPLPDMFVANLPETECATESTVDFDYPNPGQNRLMGTTDIKLSHTLTGPGCAKITAIGAGSGQLGSPSAGTPSPPKASASAAPVASKAPTYPGGVFAPGASSAPVAVPTPQPSTPVAQPAASVVPVPAPAPPKNQPPKNQQPNNTTPTDGSCTPCTNDGAIVCIGSKQFGLCNRGCAVAQDLAAGMACSNGVVVAATKRHVHFPRAHLHRRFTAARLL
jgi:hypothetical protein